MLKQLIIAGFHRSGTSMLAQELNNAGLFLGKRLMSPNISNADGHYEDMDFFHLHEKLLAYHQTDWQHSDLHSLDVPIDYQNEMKRLIGVRDSEYTQWGFKDPRTLLFLPEWYSQLSNPYTVVIYRHYSETSHSLLHRAAGDFLQSPKHNQMKFWKEEELSFRMWLAYNLRLIEHIKAHPKTTLVLSHDAVVKGYPVVKSLKERFGFVFDDTISSSIDLTKLSSKDKNVPLSNPDLEKELNLVWEQLQLLSSAPDQKSYMQENQFAKFTFGDLEQKIVALGGEKTEVDVMEDTLKKILSKELEMSEKIQSVRQTMHMFLYLGQIDTLLETVKSLLNYIMEDMELYKLHGDLCRLSHNEEETYNSELLLFESTPKIFPWNFQRLATSYLAFSRFDRTEFFIEKAIKGNPTNPSFYLTYAALEMKRCRYEAALKMLDHAMEYLEDNTVGMVNALLQKCTIFDQLDDEESLLQILKEVNTHKENIENPPEWINIRIESFSDNVNVDFKALWKEKVISRLKKDDVLVELAYILKTIKNPLMQNNLIERIEKQLNNLYEKQKLRKQVKAKHCAISFLVDSLPLHYYQAELLLHSLKTFTSIKQEHIIVHCTNRVEKSFLEFLEAKEIEYKIVDPYLDGKYCNKLTQLESFIKQDSTMDGVILLDTDTFFLSNPIIEDRNKIAGKTVDASNPPITVLKRIYKEANLTLPHEEATDWINDNSQTIYGNFNGGFYYIPSKDIETINTLWKKWAEWLYAHSELFDTPTQAIHTDQVSMSMAIAESKIEVQILSSNQNYPTHGTLPLRLFKQDKPISMLHYHREISRFGLLSNKKISEPLVIEVIDKVNESIAAMESSFFYEGFRYSLIEVPKRPDNFDQIENRMKEIASQFQGDTKLILHAGTPKTGTTTLQFYLNENYNQLKQARILYPQHNIASPVPKHQWIVNYLKNEQFDLFLNDFESSFRESNKEIDTIIFSTEGIYNHWWDFSCKTKAFMTLLNSYFDISLWVWFREPVSFARSYYRQNLKNPRIKEIYCYGQDLSFEEMLKDEWFQKHFDYLGFILEIESIFRPNKTEIFKYTGDIVGQVNNLLKMSSYSTQKQDHNIGLHTISEDILRIVNRYPLSPSEKNVAIDNITNINQLLIPYIKKDDTQPVIKSVFLERLLSKQLPILNEKYALDWSKNNHSKKKQLIIAGFHRSGTSMLAQEIQRAGLFLGENLVSPNIANTDGFFEDKEIFKLHENILRHNKSSWQHCSNMMPVVPLTYKTEIKEMIKKRGNKNFEWGFKDPRTAFFLAEWYEQLKNPFTVIIYRHYSETTRSLLHRASRNIMFRPNPVTLRFWKEKDLAYKMWLAYNKALVNHVKSHPDTTLLISHDAVINGVNVVNMLRERFNFNLHQNTSTCIKSSLLSEDALNAPSPEKNLQKELDDLWQTLQKYSAVPAQKNYDTLFNENKSEDFNIEKNIQFILQYNKVSNTTLQEQVKILETLNAKEKLKYQWKMDVLQYLQEHDFIAELNTMLQSIDNSSMQMDLQQRIEKHLQEIEKMNQI